MNSSLDPSIVKQQAQTLGRVLSPEQSNLLTRYLELLVKWNQRMNLVGPKKWEDILETLLQDSWHLADLLQSQNIHPQQTLDLGAGAGLPGIPLRIFWSWGHYFLVEPRQKRALFMEQALMHLALPQTKVIQGRMEDLTDEHRQAELIISRAFKPWRELLMDVKNYLAPQGQIVVMTNEPEPHNLVPGYVLQTIHPYVVAHKQRYLWLFALIRKSFT